MIKIKLSENENQKQLEFNKDHLQNPTGNIIFYGERLSAFPYDWKQGYGALSSHPFNSNGNSGH